MVNWFGLLKFQSFSVLTNSTFTELDTFADYKFKNGIEIRVLNGLMADSTPQKPYEMIVRRPHCNHFSIPNLSKHDVLLKMNELHLETEII